MRELDCYVLKENTSKPPHACNRYDHHTIVRDYAVEHSVKDTEKVLRELMQWGKGRLSPVALLHELVVLGWEQAEDKCMQRILIDAEGEEMKGMTKHERAMHY